MSTRTARLLLVALGLLLPAAFTLGDAPTASTDLLARGLRRALRELTPLSPERVSTDRTELLANVLLFVPLGALLPLALPRTPLTVLLAVPLLLSLSVEVAQLVLLSGRTPDDVDVVANGLGGAVGLVLGADLLRRGARSSPG